jgi:hypothetical protein
MPGCFSSTSENYNQACKKAGILNTATNTEGSMAIDPVVYCTVRITPYSIDSGVDAPDNNI